MAIKATIFKADLQIADMDRNYYAEHSLTLARHPSETGSPRSPVAACVCNAVFRMARSGSPIH